LNRIATPGIPSCAHPVSVLLRNGEREVPVKPSAPLLDSTHLREQQQQQQQQ